MLALIALAGCSSRTAPGPPVTLTIIGFGLEAGEQLREDALDDFSRKTNIKIDLIPTLGTSSEQLVFALGRLTRKSPAPDIYLIDVVWPGTLHEHLLDLKPYVREDAGRHIRLLLENATVSHRLVSLPLYVNAGMLYYRDDLLRKYGYRAPPATWEELERIAAHIQAGERRRGRKDFWGYVWQGNNYEGLTCNALEWQASFGGGQIVETNGTVTVNNPRTAQAFERAAGWVGTISPRSVLSYTETDSLNVFRSGNAAFMRHWSSAFQGVARSMQAGTAGVELLPMGPKGRAHSIGGFQLAISRYSSHPREAAELVIHLSSPEVQSRRAVRRGFIPTYSHLYRDPMVAGAVPQVTVLEGAPPDSWVMRPSKLAGARYADLSRVYSQAVHDILSGKGEAQSTLELLEQELTQRLAIKKADWR
jgi:trehalose/maltose transport system substrate-binding protein